MWKRKQVILDNTSRQETLPGSVRTFSRALWTALRDYDYDYDDDYYYYYYHLLLVVVVVVSLLLLVVVVEVVVAAVVVVVVVAVSSLLLVLSLVLEVDHDLGHHPFGDRGANVWATATGAKPSTLASNPHRSYGCCYC